VLSFRHPLERPCVPFCILVILCLNDFLEPDHFSLNPVAQLPLHIAQPVASAMLEEMMVNFQKVNLPKLSTKAFRSLHVWVVFLVH
jgi:hypothetical protein